MYSTPQSVISAGVIIPFLATIAVLLRFHTRISRHQGIGGDDWATVLGLFLTWALSVVVIVGAAGGSLGYRSRFDGGVRAPDPFARKISLSFAIIEKLALGAIKISVVLLYRRIFRGPTFDIVTKVALVLISLWSLTYFLTQILVCGTSVHYLWEFRSAAEFMSRCFDNQKYGVSFGITDAVTDIMILCIPIPMVWKLQMPAKKKFGVVAVFLLGSFSVAAGVGKMAIQIHLTYFQNADTRDMLATLTDLLVWSLVESGVAVVASCLPTIHHLVFGVGPDSFFYKLRSKFSRSSLRSYRSKSLDSNRSPSNHSSRTSREGSEKAFHGQTVSIVGSPGKLSNLPAGQIGVQYKLSRAEYQV